VLQHLILLLFILPRNLTPEALKRLTREMNHGQIGTFVDCCLIIGTDLIIFLDNS
jgi:hypothetical protein